MLKQRTTSISLFLLHPSLCCGISRRPLWSLGSIQHISPTSSAPLQQLKSSVPSSIHRLKPSTMLYTTLIVSALLAAVQAVNCPPFHLLVTTGGCLYGRKCSQASKADGDKYCKNIGSPYSTGQHIAAKVGPSGNTNVSNRSYFGAFPTLTVSGRQNFVGLLRPDPRMGSQCQTNPQELDFERAPVCRQNFELIGIVVYLFGSWAWARS